MLKRRASEALGNLLVRLVQPFEGLLVWKRGHFHPCCPCDPKKPGREG